MNEFVYTVSKDGDSLTIKETWMECDIAEEYLVGGEWVRDCPVHLKYLDKIICDNYSNIVMRQLIRYDDDGEYDEDCLSHLGVSFIINSSRWVSDEKN